MNWIGEGMDRRQLIDVELFVFTYNLMFKSFIQGNTQKTLDI